MRNLEVKILYNGFGLPLPKYETEGAAGLDLFAATKEDTKISYDGDWTSFNYRKAMQEAGYKNDDLVEGDMFPTLFERS